MHILRMASMVGQHTFLQRSLRIRIIHKSQMSTVLGTLLWQLIVGVPPQGVASVAVKHNRNGLREELIPGAPTAFNDIIRAAGILIQTSGRVLVKSTIS